jgi:hypothetical protein
VTDSHVHCQLCGIQPGPAEAQLLSWVMDRENGRTRWTCPDCAASNIRSLEAKLAPEWW